MLGFPNIAPPGPHPGPNLELDLFVFCNRPTSSRALVEAGATGVVIDWERRGKRRRQGGADTQINRDRPAHLAAVRAATSGRVLCRVNPWGPLTAAEIDLAVGLGADEVLLPMVRTPAEVDGAVAAVAGRCGLGILVETADAVGEAAELARRPLSRIYVGLNDLMIDRGGTSLFAPLVDGTADRVAEAAAAGGIPFGMAGVTVPEGGRPVPCRLILGALARVGASFTFLRRSFHRDVAGRDVAVEIPRIADAARAAYRRTPGQVTADHAALVSAVPAFGEEQAV